MKSSRTLRFLSGVLLAAFVAFSPDAAVAAAPAKVTVKFNANGGTGTMRKQVFRRGVAQKLRANAFKRSGWVFLGWAKSRNGAVAYKNRTAVKNLATAGKSATLYAKWAKKSYKVKFCHTYKGEKGKMKAQKMTYGKAKNLAKNKFKRTGYKFKGWATSKSLAKKGTVKFKNNKKVKNLTATGKTVCLYAVWAKRANTYTVYFDANGGSGWMDDQGFSFNVAQALRANAFTRTGYTFAGWATSASGPVVYRNRQSVSGLASANGAVVTLYAKWRANTYTVRFCDPWIGDQDFTFGTVQALRANARTRKGWVFAGWATRSGGPVVYPDRKSVSNLATADGAVVELYAVWWSQYMVVDLSGGPSAASYPVTNLTGPPSGGFNTDEYKTTKLVLRCLEPGPVPTRDATITKPFYVGLFEVTQRQWELVMGTRPSYFSNISYYSTRPVETVTFNMIRGSSLGAQWPASNAVDADSFLGKLRARTGLDFDLPTEAQWEYACRAGTTTDFNNGRNITAHHVEDRVFEDSAMNEVGRYWCNGGRSASGDDFTQGWNDNTSCSTAWATAAVGSYRPNDWGLYDMHGNVNEWCLDRVSQDLTDVRIAPLSGSDPVGLSWGKLRVLRGGDWSNAPDDCTSSDRGGYYTDSPSSRGGFRLAMPLSK